MISTPHFSVESVKEFGPPKIGNTSWLEKLNTKNDNRTLFANQSTYMRQLAEKAKEEMDQMRNFNMAVIDTWELKRFPYAKDVDDAKEREELYHSNVHKFTDGLDFDGKGSCGYLFPLQPALCEICTGHLGLKPEKLDACKCTEHSQSDKKQLAMKHSKAEFQRVFERISALLSGGSGVEGDDD